MKKLATIGLAGFGLWQVTPDKGADLPATLRGGRTRVFGLGPELDVTIPNGSRASRCASNASSGSRRGRAGR